MLFGSNVVIWYLSDQGVFIGGVSHRKGFRRSLGIPFGEIDRVKFLGMGTLIKIGLRLKAILIEQSFGVGPLLDRLEVLVS